jgi:O-antigen/teichoic acid export membrane protein
MSLIAKARAALENFRGKGLGSAAIYLGATILARAGAFVLIPLYTRRLTIEEYGEYALAQTLVQILPTFLSLGLVSAIARFYYDEKDVKVATQRVGSASRWMAALTLGSATLLQVGVLAFWPAGGRGVAGRWEVSCVIWAAAGGALAAIPALYLRCAQRPLAASAFQVGQFVSIAGAGLFLVAGLDRGLRGAIEASALAYGIDGLVGLFYILFVLKAQ